jgi:hypothetical protein
MNRLLNESVKGSEIKELSFHFIQPNYDCLFNWQQHEMHTLEIYKKKKLVVKCIWIVNMLTMFQLINSITIISCNK